MKIFTKISMTVFPILNVNTLHLNKEMYVTKIIMGFINYFTYIMFYMKTSDVSYFGRNIIYKEYICFYLIFTLKTEVRGFFKSL
jgi:hypothetical protein